jgi:hypothetical protein
MQRSDLPETEHILDFVALCRDEQIAPYPVGLRVISACTGLSMYRVRVGTEQLLIEAGSPRWRAYPDHGLVLP